MKKEEFISLVLNFLDFPGKKYTNPKEGCNIEGFDCSGFVNFILKQAEYPGYIPRHANEFFDSFGILVHEKFRGPGDLIFFTDNDGIYPSHVGIMISKDEYVGKVGKKIRKRKIKKREVKGKGNSQIYLSNPIGFKRITIGTGRYRKRFLEWKELLYLIIPFLN